MDPADVFTVLEQTALDAYYKIVRLRLEDLCVDGCIVKASCEGHATGPSPVDQGDQDTKRSVMVEGHGIAVWVQVASANRHDLPLLSPTLECLGRFGFDLPEYITVYLNASYDSRRTRELLEVLGCDALISPRGTPLQASRCWGIERSNSWHTLSFRRLQICTEVRTRGIEASIALAINIITIRNLIHRAWTTHRWDQRPTRKP